MFKNIEKKLTFDDVLLVPQYSEILPAMVDVKSKLTRNVTVNVPLVAAAMDTVTESEMAIAMALHGGIGIIHKNLNPEAQAREVAIVKRFENGFIKNPITLSPEHSIQDAYNIRKEEGYKAIPITEDGKQNGKIVGLLTANDYFINKHRDCKVKDRMTPFDKLLVAEGGVTLEEANDILEESKHSKLIVVNNKKDRNLKALVTRRDIERKQDYPNVNVDKDNNLIVGAAVGPANNMEERVELLVKAGVNVLVVDTAHGHSKGVIETVKYIKKNYKNMDVIAGNIATADAVKALAQAGADAVKVGIGPGSICTTRIIAGIGVPQLSAIHDCVIEARKHKIPVIADGGVKYSGDVAKALAAGASTVMVGSLLAGTKESPGEMVYIGGKTYKTYRGMGSVGAMSEGGKERYGQADIQQEEKFVPEGIEGQTIYKGSVEGEIYQLVGGLKSSMGYQGAKNIAELHKKAKFVQISAASLRESHPHDIMISKEAPNYREG